MKKYAVAIVLIRNKNQGLINLVSFLSICSANSEDEAVGSQITEAMNQYPEHQIAIKPSVCEI